MKVEKSCTTCRYHHLPASSAHCSTCIMEAKASKEDGYPMWEAVPKSAEFNPEEKLNTRFVSKEEQEENDPYRR